MIADAKFEIEVACGISLRSPSDGGQYGVLRYDDGRYGVFQSFGTDTPPMAWMTEDYVPQVKRTFNDGENEAFAGFVGGAVTNATSQSSATTTVKGASGGLSTLEGTLTRP
ncbi:MAG: hypothetical protein MK180_14845 [Rhodobacteraceae bacterium]|nr:hypothetical protein [Paracoccaceae bacterium]